jgi:hypothetical protein
LRDLSINKERRDRTRALNRERKVNAKYEDYEWLELVITGKINGLLVLELDRYLDRHNLHKKCRKKDKVKAITADILRRQTNNILKNVIEESSQPDIPDELDEESDISDSDDDDDDDSDNDLVVFNDFDDENDEGNEKQDSSKEKLFVSTRSGRQAGSWRLTFMD